MLAKILKRAGFGALLGISINSLIKALTSDGLAVTPTLAERLGGFRSATLVELLLIGLFGALCMSGTLLYDSERLPLSAATVIHCLCCILPFAPLALFLGWVSQISELLVMAAIQLFAFCIVWLIMYALYRKEVRALNKLQETYLNDTNP